MVRIMVRVRVWGQDAGEGEGEGEGLLTTKLSGTPSAHRRSPRLSPTTSSCRRPAAACSSNQRLFRA